MRFRFKSFATRLSVYSIIFTIIIFTIVMVIFYTNSRQRIIETAITHTHSLLTNMADEIDDKLNQVEVAVHNSEWILKENLHNPDSLYKITTSLVRDNGGIIASGIAFEPNYYSHKGEYFMIYAYEQENKITYSNLGGIEYNYFFMDWYQIPKLLKKSYWSEPYFDKNGGNIMMSTYSHPIYDNKGKMIAMLTTDISLAEFSSMVKGLEIYEEGSSFLISRNGYYVTTSVEDEKSETIFSTAFEQGSKPFEQLGHDMITGKTGVIEFLYKNEPWYAFYTSIPDIGWSVCTICSADVILDGLYETSRNIIIIFILGVLLLFISTFKVVKSLAKPLEEFSISANEIAKGKFDVPLPRITTGDEMQSLRNAFSVMQSSLASYIDEIKVTTINNQRIESELHIARKIQMDMLPKVFPERGDVNLHAVLYPAKEVGGDLYDFFIHGNNLYFAIGDVSGKGVPAALVMAITSSIFRSMAPMLNNPSDIVTAINKVVCEGNSSNMFVTIVVGILNLETGSIKMCNAGHNPLIYINAQNKATFINVEQNIPVGVFDDFSFQENTIIIEPASKIVLYTDGVTEAENEAKELYSDAKLLKTLQSVGDNNAKTIIEELLQSISEHVNVTPQSDDLTILTINFKPNFIKPMNKELVIYNDIKDIAKVETFVEEIGESLHLTRATIVNINLAIEEAVANIIMYAYPPPERNTIHLYAKFEDDELTFLLTDNGTPFDPTQSDPPDVDLTVEDRPIGGLGILLIRKIMNSVTYNRIEGRNLLILTKKI